MAVERAQARDLPLDGRRRGGAALLARGEGGEEGGELGVAGLERVQVALGEPGAELHEVRAVGLERVARQAALQLEVGEEVEDEVREGARWGGDGHGRVIRPRSPLSL